MRRLARKHGFAAVPPQWAGRAVPNERFARVASVRRESATRARIASGV
jgi:hypothetical protein